MAMSRVRRPGQGLFGLKWKARKPPKVRVEHDGRVRCQTPPVSRVGKG